MTITMEQKQWLDSSVHVLLIVFLSLLYVLRQQSSHSRSNTPNAWHAEALVLIGTMLGNYFETAVFEVEKVKLTF